MGFRTSLSLLALIALVAAPARGQEPVDCSSADHRAFDFWVGEWDVYNPRGEQVGENTITRVENGCALHERWRSASGHTGQSFSYYDASTGEWHQNWVASTGRPLRLVGGPEGGAMVMEMETPRVRHRVAWSANDDGSVRQLWKTSTDGGETWETAFDGEYRPDSGE